MTAGTIRVGDTITEAEELDTLVVGSVVIDHTGVAWQKVPTGAGPRWADATGKPGRISGRLLSSKGASLTVLHMPGARPPVATIDSEPLVKKGVCLVCGSAVLHGEHLQSNYHPCRGRMMTVQEALFTARAEELGDFAAAALEDADGLADMARRRAQRIREECLIRVSE